MSTVLSSDAKLPPPPPDDLEDGPAAPSIPPKYSVARPAHLGPLPIIPPLEPLSVPLTPQAQLSPISPSHSSEAQKSKKTNPLNDLIETERAYVDQLTGIIRKVAAAWSRSNLPPSELDTMFRSIEGVYKANRSLLTIDDLESPYSTYSSKFLAGFDAWEPVQSNPKLSPILANFKLSNPPLAGSDSEWTLDALFLLPKSRLKYYRKLYGRLLKSTAPGRSDHKLLVGAVDRLDRLFDTVEQRQTVRVGSFDSSAPPPPTQDLEDEVVLDMRTQSMRSEPEPQRTSDIDHTPGSGSSSTRDSGTSGEMSRETVSTATSRASTATLAMPISDLERRLSNMRCMDIFTMSHRARPFLLHAHAPVKLQMSPPSLTFTREMRCSMDLVIRVTPRTTGQEIVHRRGHIFLLSDLFLVCERMTLEERAGTESNGPDMWLCYPPLAGKVLRVSELPGSDNEMQVHIMRKETLILSLESPHVRDNLMKDFKDCIEFAASVGPVSKQPPPPVPSLPAFGGPPKSPAQNISPHRLSPPSASSPLNGTSSPPLHPSPGLESLGSRTSSLNQQSPRSSDAGSFKDQISRPMPPHVTSPPPLLQRLPSLHDPSANGSVAIGQAFPVSRNPSFNSQHHTPYGPGPGRAAPAAPPIPPMKAPPMYPQYSGGPGGFSGPPMQGEFPPFGSQPRAPFMEGPLPPRPPSEPHIQGHSTGRRSPSTRSLSAHQERPRYNNIPPDGVYSGAMNSNQVMIRNNSMTSLNAPLHAPQPRTMLPSAAFNRSAEASFADPSPPNSPVAESSALPSGPVTSSITATFKCKVFLKQQHAQWKSLGSAGLKLYTESPTNIKQLVVEDDKRNVLISTIVLTDGVERVGKTGVAVELSDRGARTGVVYMIQLRNEKSAGGLFDSLLQGSDRAK
ncbi:hypothetical protein D9757_002844 [Collybiopsis confluens]|uniref:DH domain-containing protein n=1 Tax=Collybiopsis confluens TaxID=2823264 RepID=A0A8H5MDS6_9AGAR|nr:hypothetical protein D9757_002844 [Collybiopsis confluens]